jgi:hypothetical protein
MMPAAARQSPVQVSPSTTVTLTEVWTRRLISVSVMVMTPEALPEPERSTVPGQVSWKGPTISSFSMQIDV